MAQELTRNAQAAARRSRIQPQLVLKIDGLDTIFGAMPVQKFVQIGDPGLEIGDGWVIGGLGPVDDSADLISRDSPVPTITQRALPDKLEPSYASSMSIELVDKDGFVSEIVSPGVVLEDVLTRKVRVFQGFQNTAWPQDYIEIFAGVITDIIAGPTSVQLEISHPDQKKLQQIFRRVDTTLAVAIDAVGDTIELASTEGLIRPVDGPDGSPDGEGIKLCIRIDDEVISYTGISGNTLTGCDRGELETLPAAHELDAKVTSFYVVAGDPMTLALKLMLSGLNGPFLEDVAVGAFNRVDASTSVPNAIFFEGIDLERDLGLVAGDYLTTTGAAAGANNVTAKTIASIVRTDFGSYALVNDVAFVDERPTAAVCAFRSQYDTLGEGLKMTPDQVDVAAHERWRQTTLSPYAWTIYLKDTVEGRELLDRKIYGPAAAFAIPRNGKASVSVHVGPIPTERTVILDRDNIGEGSKIMLRRSISRNFYNGVVMRYDESPLENEFQRSREYRSDPSLSRIPNAGDRFLDIAASGMRTGSDGELLARLTAERLLGRYRYGAEFIEKLPILFGSGFNVDVGDLVILDPEGLHILDSSAGDREKLAKFFEVVGKRQKADKADVEVDLVDTAYDLDERYGLIAPSSLIAAGSSETAIIIQDSFGELYPGDEKRKWEDYIGLPVLIHDEDWTFQEEARLIGFDPLNPYRMLLAAPGLSVAPPAGYIVDIPTYPDDADKATNRLYKLMHAFMTASIEVTAGTSSTEFEVDPGDVGAFFEGATVLVHSEDFSQASAETTVASIVGNTITVADDLGFTPAVGHRVEFIGFPDREGAYRWS